MFRISATHLASRCPCVHDSDTWLCWEERERHHGGEPRKTVLPQRAEFPGKERYRFWNEKDGGWITYWDRIATLSERQ